LPSLNHPKKRKMPVFRLRSLFQIVCGLLLIYVMISVAHGEQPDRSRYVLADQLRAKTRNKVYRDEIRAHWFDSGKRFWYRVDQGKQQHRYILIDAENGKRTDAFDHERLAVALSQASGKEINAAALPLRNLKFQATTESITFSFASSQWDCHLGTYEIKKVPAADLVNDTTVAILPGPRTARYNGPETHIQFVNETEQTIKIFWVNDLQNPTFYATLKPKSQHSQHTFSGHVWLVTDQQNKPLGVYAASEDEGVAVIDGSWRPGQRRPARENGTRSRNRNQTRRGGRSSSSSPNQDWEARIEGHNVVIHNREKQLDIQISQDGTDQDAYLPRFYWSPDSSKLVVMQQHKGEQRQVHLIDSAPDDQLQPKLQSFTYAKPGDEIDQQRPRLFDVEQKSQQEISDKLFPNPWSITQIRWEADSSRFTFLYNQRGHQVLRVVAVDAKTGAATTLIEETSDTFICYSSKLFLQHIGASDEIIWMSERDGWNHLYLHDATTGALKNQITSGPWVVRNVERVDPETRQIWFSAGGIREGQDPYQLHHCRIRFDGSELTLLTEGDGTHSIEYSPDQRFYIDRYSRVDLPPVHELRRSLDGSLVCELEQADWSELLAMGWHPPERFVAKGRDDVTDIYGVIYRPTDFDPNKQYPVIEQIYAGPQSAYVPKRFAAFHGPQAMAELGFILVQIDGMGTSHRSKAFHDVCFQDLADAGFPDRIRWIKAAAATRPWMDIGRVGIYGGSAGGQNAMRALLDHGDFYQVAAADCGCHDNRMDKIWWNEQWMGWPVGPHYAASSNVEHANRLQGHLMLLVGELDRNVDPASTLQVVDALIKADKDFELVLIPGAGHGAGGGRYGSRRQRDFFIRHLQ
jgi:dipeptidyl-peptidase-4